MSLSTIYGSFADRSLPPSRSGSFIGDGTRRAPDRVPVARLQSADSAQSRAVIGTDARPIDCRDRPASDMSLAPFRRVAWRWRRISARSCSVSPLRSSIVAPAGRGSTQAARRLHAAPSSGSVESSKAAMSYSRLALPLRQCDGSPFIS